MDGRDDAASADRAAAALVRAALDGGDGARADEGVFAPGSPARAPLGSDDRLAAYARVGDRLQARLKSAVSRAIDGAAPLPTGSGAPPDASSCPASPAIAVARERQAEKHRAEADALKVAEATARARADDLERRLEVNMLERAALQRQLDEALVEKDKSSKEALDSAISHRNNRDQLLGLVTEIRETVARRFGFVPHAAQAEFNAFLAALAEAEKPASSAADLPPPPPRVAVA